MSKSTAKSQYLFNIFCFLLNIIKINLKKSLYNQFGNKANHSCGDFLIENLLSFLLHIEKCKKAILFGLIRHFTNKFQPIKS